MNKNYALHAAQRGATLLVALIFLLIMTIAGISAMRFATFEERMASNTETSNEMFQQAQSEIQAQLLNYNTSVELRQPLIDSKDKPYDTGDPESNPALKSLPRSPLPKQTHPINPLSLNNIVAEDNTLRYVQGEDKCCDDGSSCQLFQCLDYEMNVTAKTGSAISQQTQGITYKSPKAN